MSRNKRYVVYYHLNNLGWFETRVAAKMCLEINIFLEILVAWDHMIFGTNSIKCMKNRNPKMFIGLQGVIGKNIFQILTNLEMLKCFSSKDFNVKT